MRNKLLSKTLLLALGLGCTLSVSARERLDNGSPSGKPQPAGSGNKIAANCLTSSSTSSLDINNVRAMVLNGGDMWWNLSDARYEVPKVTDPNLPKRHALFAGAVWIGGRDPQGNLYLAAQTYRQGPPFDAGYWPGPLDATGEIDKDECAAWNYHAKIDKSVIEKFRNDYAQGLYASATPQDLPQEIREWPGRNNRFVSHSGNMNHELAPFINVGGDVNSYEPLLGDYPNIQGDQAIWWVMNDAGNVKEPLSNKIGLELQVTAFAFQTNDLINNMTFYKQKLINKGNIRLNDTYLGQWVDPDLGNYNDDYVGCDVARGLGICYNGDDDDEGNAGYGVNPRSVGVDFFRGPYADFTTAVDGIDNDKDGTIDEAGGEGDGIDNDRDGIIDEFEKEPIIGPDGQPVLDASGNPVTRDVQEKIIMSSFIYYNNDNNPTNGNPSVANDFYNYLRAIWRNNTAITHGKDGTDQTAPAYKFMFSDDTDPQGYGYITPTNPTPSLPPTHFAWSETKTQKVGGTSNTPADRRFLQNAGPFTLLPGAVNELTIGVVWARANSGGAQGSLGLLKYADDQAQRLFDNDFKLPQGPDAPELAITELDQQLILTLITTKFRTSNGNEVTTETYFEEDNSLKNTPGITDAVYRFEGYKVYQLKDPTVQASDVDDPNVARLVAQADVKNGVTDIITYEFDAELNQAIPRLRVQGSDEGVFHTLNITTDKFATGNDRIVNYKSYHFLVISYAYNGDPNNKDFQYLEGRKVSTGTGIPHKTQSENGGTLLTSSYGSTTEITRILGTGNGGRVLEISDQDENNIVSTNSEAQLNYELGKAPFVVKVYDPKKVQGGEFKVKLSSRVVYKRSTAAGDPLQVGDTILSTGSYTVSDTYDPATFPNKIDKQVAGRGIVRRILPTQPTDTLVTLDVEMLNDHLNGRFTAQVDIIENKGSVTTPDLDLIDHKVEPRAFRSLNRNFTATAVTYVQNDFWYLVKPNNQNEKVYADRPISDFNEQLVPDYGIAIEFKQTVNPGTEVLFNSLNGFQEASIAYSNANKWFEGVPNGPAQTQDLQPTSTEPWLLPKKTISTPSPILDEIDPFYAYLNVLNGTWAPYGVTNFAPSGPAYIRSDFNNSVLNRTVKNLGNVDIVITGDKSKWTRVPVLQGTFPGFQTYQLTKRGSDVPSVDKEGNPDGTMSDAYPTRPGVSMGWFPGYAIDLDRGVRLNMMFSEFGLSNIDPNNQAQVDRNRRGRDLIWNPTSEKSEQYGKHFIYVTTTPYDEGKQLGMSLDSAKYDPSLINQTTNRIYVQKNVFDKVMYVGFPRLAPGATMFASDVRVRLRVNRAFTSYNPEGNYNVRSNNTPKPYIGNVNPEYQFNTSGLVPQVGNQSVASDALKQVRVVPNPYYAYSQYEQRVLDNIVKITNLPRKCKISIYTVNGTLIRSFNKDDSKTFLDWNLKNESNLPIASGVYIINVDAGNIGNTVLKWFGVMRPIDLESF